MIFVLIGRVIVSWFGFTDFESEWLAGEDDLYLIINLLLSTERVEKILNKVPAVGRREFYIWIRLMPSDVVRCFELEVFALKFSFFSF